MMTEREIIVQQTLMQTLLREAEAAQLTQAACMMRPAAIGWSCRRLRLGRLRSGGRSAAPGQPARRLTARSSRG